MKHKINNTMPTITKFYNQVYGLKYDGARSQKSNTILWKKHENVLIQYNTREQSLLFGR